MRGIRTAAAELGLKARRPTRSEVTEHVLTELSRRRALSDTESLVLESAIRNQTEPRHDRLGRRKPRQYLGRASSLAPGGSTPFERKGH